MREKGWKYFKGKHVFQQENLRIKKKMDLAQGS